MLITNCLLLIFIGYISLKKYQNIQLNWSILYSLLYTTVTLPIVNYICVKFDFWSFINTNFINLPFNLYFAWVVIWSIIPVYFFKGKHLFIIALFLFWLDIVLMPILENYNFIELKNNWLLGEFIIISTVFIPSYFWAKISYEGKNTALRALYQIIVMALLFLIVLPFIMESYGLIKNLNFKFSMLEFQFFMIIIFPSLTAVNDLVDKGKGTPFPYDKTHFLVRTGVYAYCRNPIQWSFTLLYIILSYYHNSYYLLLGCLFSIAYSFGVSDFQEYKDMENRFNNKWKNYKKNTPKWYFLWEPRHIPKGTIYFDFNCNTCTSTKKWFQKQKTINLDIQNSSNYKGKKILQATYVDYLGNEYKSIKAIAHALEHINLAYASLGWFIRFPIICLLLQCIIDTMEFEKSTCTIEEK